MMAMHSDKYGAHPKVRQGEGGENVEMFLERDIEPAKSKRFASIIFALKISSTFSFCVDH